MANAWDLFVVTENKASEEATKARMSKRKEKLKLLMSQDNTIAQALARNEIILGQWQANIHDIEHVRFLKTVQDTADHAIFVESTWNRLLRQITRERAILDPQTERKWRLDMTEGRSRMRKKLMPDIRVRSEDYQPKGSTITPPVRNVERNGAGTPAVATPIEMGDHRQRDIIDDLRSAGRTNQQPHMPCAVEHDQWCHRRTGALASYHCIGCRLAILLRAK